MKQHAIYGQQGFGRRAAVLQLCGMGSLVVALICGMVWAHEGHKALSTKGARVEGDTVYLSLDAHKAVGLTTAEVDLKDLENSVTVTASVVVPWKQHAFVSTRLEGRLERILCRPGDLVKAGQKLAEIESLELENEQLELIQFKQELDLAQQTLDRAESLGTRGIVPGKDVRQARVIKLEKSSALEITRRKLSGLGISEETLDQVLRTRQPIRRLPIYSPMSGIVTHADKNPGRIVQPSEHLFEIVDLSTVWVKGMVVEAESYRVKLGQPVRVSLAGVPGKTFRGKVDYIALKADAASRTIPIWVVLENVERRASSVKSPYLLEQRWPIRPGMFGTVQIVTEQIDDAVACPTAALVTAGAETYVFVQQKPPKGEKPGEYTRRNVVLGSRTPQWVEVKEGLFPGDQVVIDGSHQLATFFVQGVLSLTLEARRNIKLQLEQVQQRPLEEVVTVNATVEVPPDRKTFASTRIPGRISRILVDLGETVRTGQVVAEVESLQFQDLQLELMQTHARLLLIENLLEAARNVKAVIAQRELLQRETDYRKTENQLNFLKRKLQTIGLAASDVADVVQKRKLFTSLPVRSPIDGFVVHINVIPGQVVQAETPLLEIHDMSKIWVRGFVFERDVPKVRIGQPVRIRLASDPSFLAVAKLVRSNYVVSSSGRVLSVWAELDNVWVDGQRSSVGGQKGPESKAEIRGPEKSGAKHSTRRPRLLDNMLARMTISINVNAPVTAVPVAAVLNEGSRAYVFVKKPDKADYFDRRAVELGHRDDRYVEIKRGLTPGEMVAIGGVQELRTAHASMR